MRERWSDVERMWFGVMVVVVEMNIPDSLAVRDEAVINYFPPINLL